MSARIVALGGGHGLYATLSAARRLTPHVTAVVTVADDGGSSGRLRSELDVVPPGDLRMALVALASDSPQGRLWATIMQHRFGGNGALAGHPIGNLILAGLNEVLADPVAALDELGRTFCSDVQWIVNTFPLIDQRMRKHDCARWLTATSPRSPPASSATACCIRS